MNPDIVQQLNQLHGLILEEREHAKALRIEEMLATVRKKEQLLSGMDLQEDNLIDPQIQELAKTVREENRRNAYLFWAALRWVRDLMGFFGQQTSNTLYGASASSRQVNYGGTLLSGRI
jgi:flagellar biosynthesis/type III secretory pathway chaperone